uniref:Ig-like domain-containing protein n=1 Tax=Gasterosteus aculeatus aculeatus TaxID=481459 RepID=A0AAQ4NY01_GASAC
MVIMFHLNQAALLSITLFMMFEQRNISVYRGESVTFTCNVSKTKVSQIQWTKGELSFVFEVSSNTTVSNLTSHRLTIDTNFPSKMNILNVQHNDTGIYRCAGDLKSTLTTKVLFS